MGAREYNAVPPRARPPLQPPFVATLASAAREGGAARAAPRRLAGASRRLPVGARWPARCSFLQPDPETRPPSRGSHARSTCDIDVLASSCAQLKTRDTKRRDQSEMQGSSPPTASRKPCQKSPHASTRPGTCPCAEQVRSTRRHSFPLCPARTLNSSARTSRRRRRT